MFVDFFKQLSKEDIDIAGGKGASLGEMTKAKIPVPSGFVVLATAFDKFLEETDLVVEIESILHKVKNKDIGSVEKSSEEIRNLIKIVKFPQDIGKEIKESFKQLRVKYVAVRSSATAEDSVVASWAGELESYLNISDKNLLDSVKKCWSSLFTPRAIFYRFEKKLQKQRISVAVVVQAMVQSETSGVCFTVHPVTEDSDQMVIEAGYGLGEAIVSGKITPDTYVVHKKSWHILDCNVSAQKIMIVRKGDNIKEVKVPKSRQEKQKMSRGQIIKAAKLFYSIEKHYGRPQDIEWAMKGDKFYIVQSRPITTLSRIRD
jgi:pyruvate,water dikinase